MRGYPKTLASREDYEYVAANFPPELWRPDWQNLLDTMCDWFFDRELADKSEGIEDATHKIEQSENETGTGTVRYVQYVWRVNPTCKLFRIGFTETEVRQKLNENDTTE